MFVLPENVTGGWRWYIWNNESTTTWQLMNTKNVILSEIKQVYIIFIV